LAQEQIPQQWFVPSMMLLFSLVQFVVV